MGLLHKDPKLLNIILDSLEDQVGGAMYISCDVANGGPVESETGYVPNNPLFGLASDSPQQDCTASCIGCLSCQDNTTVPISSLNSSDFDCGSCFDPTISVLGTAQITTTPSGNFTVSSNSSGGVGIGISSSTCSYWSSDEMASTFPGLPSLDIDPMPSLFPFSPCGASYSFAANPHQASLSCTPHSHQMLMSPNGHHHQQQQAHQQISPYQQIQHDLDQQQVQTMHDGNIIHSAPVSACYYDNTAPAAVVGTTAACGIGTVHGSQSLTSNPTHLHSSTSMYPSMSVNVSMNMTMHGYGADNSTMPIQCSQMNWNPSNTSSSVNLLYPPLLSPNTHYPAAATYSFTADFRTPNMQGIHQSTNLGTLPSLAEIGLEKEISSPTSAPMSSMLAAQNFYVGAQFGQNSIPPSRIPSTCTNVNQMHENKTYSDGGNTTKEATIEEDGSGIVLTFDDEEEDSNEEGSDIKPNLCRLCGKTYARPSTLKTHLRTHSGERPYRCPDCNKSFSQAANLTAHVRTHTGQKPFRCPICDRRFSQSSSVTTHMRTHSGERPYRCSSCKKSFSDSSTLTKHLRIHSGEKPYQCKLCLLRFSQSGNLNRHMRVHGTTNGNTNTNNVIT